VGVIKLTDEGVSPGLAGVDGHVHVVLAMSLPPLLRADSNQITLMVLRNKYAYSGWAMQGSPKQPLQAVRHRGC
jgi:hypothetical protein